MDAGPVPLVAGDVRPRRRACRARSRHARLGAAARRLATDRVRHRADPVRVVGLRARRALREAHWPAQEGRVVEQPRSTAVPEGATARVIAVHKETSIVRGPDGVDRSAGVSGRFRFDALATSDFPAVGDWVTLADWGSAGAPGPAATDPVVITAVLPRRSAFVRSAADASRRSAGHLVDEQVLAANVDIAFVVAGLDHDF